MALGTYGIKRLSDVSPENVEILSLYTESRESVENATIKKLDAKSILTPYYHNSETGGNDVTAPPFQPQGCKMPYRCKSRHSRESKWKEGWKDECYSFVLVCTREHDYIQLDVN